MHGSRSFRAVSVARGKSESQRDHRLWARGDISRPPAPERLMSRGERRFATDARLIGVLDLDAHGDVGGVG